MMQISKEWLEDVKTKTPELPDAKYQRYLVSGLRDNDANIIAFDTEQATFFDAALKHYQGGAQTLANWLNTDVAGYLNANQLSLSSSKLTPEHLANLVTLIDKGTISSKIAKDLLAEVMQGANPENLVKDKGLEQVSDTGELETIIDGIIAAQPELLERVKANPKAINALLGEVMKASKGKAKPDLVRELLNKKLV
jgi:aspartyl-tRNA(Asn)/glutamyl-tRNA(Gln) amidotransferase subunit B